MSKDELSERRRKKRRDGLRARLKTPFADLFVTSGVCLLAMGVAFWFLNGSTFLEWLVVIPVLLFANFFEWWAHRNVMHRPRKYFGMLYHKHTLMHHRMYDQIDM